MRSNKLWYRCSGSNCPGYRYSTSECPHPITCSMEPEEAVKYDVRTYLAGVERALDRQDWKSAFVMCNLAASSVCRAFGRTTDQQVASFTDEEKTVPGRRGIRKCQ